MLDQVRNTIPFLFENSIEPNHSYLALLRDTATDLSHEDYFRLLLSAHFATVSSFVPTDVDNQIRFKLWHPGLPLPTLLIMMETVIESAHWDLTALSTRFVRSPVGSDLISGLHGEWFSVAVAAYAALRRRSPDVAAGMFKLIEAEIEREARIYRELRKAGDGIGLLKAATLMAHNLGDLDRVIDQWNLSPSDPLRNVTHSSATLVQARALNKACMATENHRHLILRDPRCLRRSQDFLLPVGPFFDSWGATVGKHPGISAEEVGEVTEALVAGWEKLQPAVGYARALAGILESFPGGLNKLCQYIPARVARILKAGELRALCIVPRNRFEEQWARMALKFAASN